MDIKYKRDTIKNLIFDTIFQDLPYSIRQLAGTGNVQNTKEFFSQMMEHQGIRPTSLQIERLEGIAPAVVNYPVDKLLIIYER